MRERVCGAGAGAERPGAHRRRRAGAFRPGHYYPPTVITGAALKSEVVQSEVFGPVITVSSFNDKAQALAYGNDVLYGLAASA